MVGSAKSGAAAPGALDSRTLIGRGLDASQPSAQLLNCRAAMIAKKKPAAASAGIMSFSLSSRLSRSCQASGYSSHLPASPPSSCSQCSQRGNGPIRWAPQSSQNRVAGAAESAGRLRRISPLSAARMPSPGGGPRLSGSLARIDPATRPSGNMFPGFADDMTLFLTVLRYRLFMTTG
jgi:hypothetical protein